MCPQIGYPKSAFFFAREKSGKVTAFFVYMQEKEKKTKNFYRLLYRKRKKKHFCFFFAVRTGLEPATPCVTGMYSNQLNYRTNFYLKMASFSKPGAKVLLLFELTKYFSKKNVFSFIFVKFKCQK